MSHPIPGFPVHVLERDGEDWVIRNLRTGRVLPGAQRPGRARRFNLRGLHGYANKTLAGWMAHAGLEPQRFHRS